LGLAYGTAIPRPLPTADAVETLLRHARHRPFEFVDTARAYGRSEARIGAHLQRGRGFAPCEVGTKIGPLPEVYPNSPADHARILAEESLAASRQALGLEWLERVLLHRGSHLSDAGGAVWHMLVEEKERGRIGQIGVSVQSLEEVEHALSLPTVDIIQLPCNILDWRFDSTWFSSRLYQCEHQPDIEVRSVFLQGVLTTGDPAVFPETNTPYERADIAYWLRDRAATYCDGAMDELCLRYALSLDWVTSVVLGIDDVAQINRIDDIAAKGPLPDAIRDALRADRPSVPGDVLDPAKWRPKRL
jgi:spore coat polysaccharide biosynthesis protein SpsF